MKKILFIIGLLRAKSFNRQVANVAKEIIGNRAEVQELGYGAVELTWWLSDRMFGRNSNIAVGATGNTVEVVYNF